MSNKRSGELKKNTAKLQFLDLSEKEISLIEFLIASCRELKWGKIEVLIKDGQPTMASRVRQDVRFDIPKDP